MTQALALVPRLSRRWITDVVSRAVRHPASQMLIILWACSAGVVAAHSGIGTVVGYSGLLAGILVFALATHWVTEPFPLRAADPEDGGERRRYGLQTACLLVIIGLIFFRSLIFHRIVHVPWSVPGFTDWRTNPVFFVLLPLLSLWVLGAAPRELGLGKGHRVWPVSLLWSVPPIIAVGVALPLGWKSPAGVLSDALLHVYLNVPEEFLFRGALQTRLSRITGPAWGIVLTALVFGLVHIAANLTRSDANLVSAAAEGIIKQAVWGLAFGIVFYRTGNLIAPSLVHVLNNVSPRWTSLL